EQMIREVHRILKTGGHFIALGPNLRYLPGEYWDFWDHLIPITDRSLTELLENLDFEIVNCYPRFLPYTTRSRLPQAPWLVRLYLKAPLVWKFMGGQFLIRAHKP
ncbi:MAG: glycosyl transferase, partial [bacterium]